MSFELITIPCLSDNYAFVLFNVENRSALLVDAPEADPINQVLIKNNLNLEKIFLTHHHADHIDGLDNIPKKGKCLIVSNHPMGPADAVALYHSVSKVRKDAFFFANEIFVYLLGAFDNMMAPVVWDQETQLHTATKKTIERMRTFFSEERIGILFPSGRLSKFTLFGLKERAWQKTPLSIAERHECLLVPAYIVGRNSWFFYFASVINKQLRDVTQLNELLNKKNKKIKIIIGKPVSRNQLYENDDDAIKQLKKLSDSLKK